MHILHVTPYYTPAYAFGGVVRSVEGMALALARRGHTVTVLTTDALALDERSNSPREEMLDGVRVVRVRNLLPRRANLSSPLGMVTAAYRLARAADVVHCHEFRTVENLIVTPLAARLSKPLALSPHGTLPLATGRSRTKAAWDWLFSRGMARRFRHVIGLTDAETSEARALWGQWGAQEHTDFYTIPNGIVLSEFANLPGREAFRARYGLGEAPVCLFMGRLHPRKGARLLAEAFRLADVPEARLVIAGPDEGDLDGLKPLLDGRIVYTGYLNGEDRLAAFAAADLLALPAVGEGLPMVVLEAMAAGLPVIVSPGCNLPEVPEYGAGLMVEAAPKPLAGALRRLLMADPPRRESMGAAARTLVQERFTWDAVAEQLERVYRTA